MFILAETCETLKPVLGIIKLVLNVIRFVVPVVLILMGTIDLVKAVTQGKEDDIKKGQKTLITRAITAVLVFLVPTIVSVIMGLVGGDMAGGESFGDCWKNTTAGIPAID